MFFFKKFTAGKPFYIFLFFELSFLLPSFSRIFHNFCLSVILIRTPLTPTTITCHAPHVLLLQRFLSRDQVNVVVRRRCIFLLNVMAKDVFKQHVKYVKLKNWNLNIKWKRWLIDNFVCHKEALMWGDFIVPKSNWFCTIFSIRLYWGHSWQWARLSSGFQNRHQVSWNFS